MVKFEFVVNDEDADLIVRIFADYTVQMQMRVMELMVKRSQGDQTAQAYIDWYNGHIQHVDNLRKTLALSTTKI